MIKILSEKFVIEIFFKQAMNMKENGVGALDYSKKENGGEII